MKIFRTALLLLALSITGGSLSAQETKLDSNEFSPATTSAVPAEEASKSPTFPEPGTTRLVEQKEVEQLINSHGADLLVVNMWATYCGPCVEELPYFIELANKNDKKKGVGTGNLPGF